MSPGWDGQSDSLGLNAFDAGLALMTGSFWALLFVPAGIAALLCGAIRPEERYLAGKFGAEYTSYRARVRPWLLEHAHMPVDHSAIRHIGLGAGSCVVGLPSCSDRSMPCRSRVAEVVLGELTAASFAVETHDEAVLIGPYGRAVRHLAVLRRAGGHHGVTVDRDR